MTLVEFIILLVVAAVCGALGEAIAGFSPGGFFAKVGVGFIGALVGSWIARSLRLPELFSIEVGHTAFPIVWSVLGSTLFVAFLSLFARARYWRTVLGLTFDGHPGHGALSFRSVNSASELNDCALSHDTASALSFDHEPKRFIEAARSHARPDAWCLLREKKTYSGRR